MKSLLLVRHAKSSWDLDVDDFDRPLNHRGKHDAPAMAKRLQKKDIKIDAIVSSPAKRALATAACFADEYNIKEKDIIAIPSLYEPTVGAFYDAIKELDDDLKRVAIFSHNPGITNFANSLGVATVDDMPTCAVFAVKADIKKWEDFAEAKKEFWFFDYPKAQ
jgi:phosphohistidine phosphatase